MLVDLTVCNGKYPQEVVHSVLYMRNVRTMHRGMVGGFREKKNNGPGMFGS